MMLIPHLTNGWLGYFVQCAAAYGTGSLQERVLPNRTVFASTSGGGPAGIQPLPAATSPLSSAVYNFAFTLERNALDELIITTSLEFAGASFTDNTGNAGAFTFDRVGFQGTTDLNADKVQMTNVDVAFIPASVTPPPVTTAFTITEFGLGPQLEAVGGGPTLRWKATAGRSYAVEGSNDLFNWQRIGAPVFALLTSRRPTNGAAGGNDAFVNGSGRGTRSMMATREVVGKKGATVDAGMRVPLSANWPGRIAKGSVCRDLVDTTDFLPTVCEAAAAKVSGPLDGRSFFLQMCGGKGKPREWIDSWYSPRQGNDRSVREFAFNHRFKLYRGAGSSISPRTSARRTRFRCPVSRVRSQGLPGRFRPRSTSLKTPGRPNCPADGVSRSYLSPFGRSRQFQSIA